MEPARPASPRIPELARQRARARRQQRVAWLQLRAMGWLQGAKLLLRARGTRRRFTCQALGGGSLYNICINSDLTVSCNCQDYDGAGQLGDLREQALEHILRGPRAAHFRAELASGRLPIRTCARCPELRLVSRDEALRRQTRAEVPRGLMVENTVSCNLSCTACPRAPVLRARKQLRWNEAETRRVAETIAQHRIEHVSFFNLGEPLVSPAVLGEIQAIRRLSPRSTIVMSTNGALLAGERMEAALLLDHVMVSLDGDCQAAAERYQVGIDFERAYRGMAALVAERQRRSAARPLVEWKYVVFRWNDRREQIERALQLAREAGVDRMTFWPAIIPLHGVSWRCRTSRFFRSLGSQTPYCRVVDLRDRPAPVGATSA